MKTKSLFLVALMFLIAGTTMAQDYAFRVLTAKGNNTASNSKNAIRVGSKLNDSDVIVMEEGGYLGLLHNNGQTVELRTKGTYKVNELASNLKASNNSSLTARYANYVVSELTTSAEEASGENRYKHMAKTGAVSRGNKTAVTILQQSKVTMLGDKLEIEWFVYEDLAKISAKDVREYRVVLTDLRNNELYSEITKQTSYLIDFSRPELQDQTTILYRVEVADEDKKDVKSANQVIAKEKETDAKKEIREQLDQIGDDTALGHLIKAQYLEETEYYAEAAMAYKAAIALAPDVETYKILYDSFTERNKMSEEAIVTAKDSTNE